MKTLITITIAAALLTTFASAQTDRYSDDASYGLAISENHTASGHGSSVSFSTNIRKGKKSLEVGAIYGSDENKISGADVKYKVFMGTPNEFVFQNKKVRPFFQYNCMYQNKTTEQPLAMGGNLKSGAEMATVEGVVSTIEHYAGFGIQVKLMNNVHIESSFGAGAYIGSVKAEDIAQQSNSGLSFSGKIGVGITL